MDKNLLNESMAHNANSSEMVLVQSQTGNFVSFHRLGKCKKFSNFLVFIPLKENSILYGFGAAFGSDHWPKER